MKELWRDFNKDLTRELRDVRALFSQFLLRNVEKFCNNTILINWCILLAVLATWGLIGLSVWNVAEWLWLK